MSCIAHFESSGKRYCFTPNCHLHEGVHIVTLGAVQGTYIVASVNSVGSNGDVRVKLVPTTPKATSMSVEVRSES